MRPASPVSQPFEKRQQGMAVVVWESREALTRDHAFASVSEDGVGDRARTAIVEKSDARADAPQRRGTPFAAAGLSLHDFVV